jgi:protein TonB
MAFVDQRTDRNQRAVVMTVVAVLQGAAIVALINGLAVRFTKTPPIPNPQASDIPVMPLPTPIPPPPPKPPIQQRDPVPAPQPPLPPGPVDQTVDQQTPPLPPEPLPPRTDDPPAPPKPLFTPRAARPRNAPASWATSNDYPPRDLREGNQGVTRFSLTIGADGRVQSCTVTGSSGFPGLDKAACDNISRRARFEPATDGGGARIIGSYSGAIRWVIPQD